MLPLGLRKAAISTDLLAPSKDSRACSYDNTASFRCPARNVAASVGFSSVVGVASSGVLCEAGSTGGSTQTVTVAAGSGSAPPQAVRPTSERAAAATASRIRKRRRWRGVRPVMSVECATAGWAATRRLRAVTYA